MGRQLREWIIACSIGRRRVERVVRVARGMSTLIMAMSTATIRLTTTLFAVFAKENDQMGVFSFKSLYNAYLSCRKGKRNTINTLRFEADLLGNLARLQRELVTQSYQPSRSVCFYTDKPKLREIVAADFADRVVHHCLVPKLEKIFEPKFIDDSYACRRNKGTHAAVSRLSHFMRRVECADNCGGHARGWYLQLDIRSFFMSIDHAVLLSILSKHVQHPRLLWLASVIIRHNPMQNCHVKDHQGLANKIPNHKSLFHTDAGKGLPIGNLASQFFANVYLNELDQFIKHRLKCRYYLRYVDDFILLHPSPEYLQHAKQHIERFCGDQLKLQFKEDVQPKPCNQGIDFLGYVTRPRYKLVRRRVVGNLKNKLHQFAQQHCVQGQINQRNYQHLQLPPASAFQLQQVLASYLGHFKHANAKRLCMALFGRFDFLPLMFALDVSGMRLQSRLSASRMQRQGRQQQSFRQQVSWFKANHPQHLLLVQLGRFCELYDDGALTAAKHSSLAVRKSSRGFRYQAGFPLKQLANYKKDLRQQGVSYAVVAEQGRLHKRLKHRQITEYLTFT